MNLEKLFKTVEVWFGDTFNLERRDCFLVYYFLWVKKRNRFMLYLQKLCDSFSISWYLKGKNQPLCIYMIWQRSWPGIVEELSFIGVIQHLWWIVQGSSLYFAKTKLRENNILIMQIMSLSCLLILPWRNQHPLLNESTNHCEPFSNIAGRNHFEFF